MPKSDIDYSNTTIYIIQHREKEELIYIGNTTNYKVRQSRHKELTETSDVKLYTMIRSNGGWDAFEMRPIKKVDCANSIEARIEEEKCRVEYKASLNTYRACITEGRSAYDKARKLKNIEQVKERDKKYRERNKEHIQQHKSQRIQCICGRTIAHDHKREHERSKVHIKLVNGQIKEPIN